MSIPPNIYSRVTRYVFEHVKKSWIFCNGHGGDVSYFTMGAATPPLCIIYENHENGVMHARAEIFDLQEQADIMVSLMPGELRVGIVLSGALAYSPGVYDAISKGYDGKPVHIVRTLANGRVMWDHFFYDDPFSAEWMALACNGDATKLHLMAVRLRYIIETRWRTAMDALVGLGGVLPRGAKKYSLVSGKKIDVEDICNRFGVIVLDGPRQFSISGQDRWMYMLVVTEEGKPALLDYIKHIDPNATLEQDVTIDEVN